MCSSLLPGSPFVCLPPIPPLSGRGRFEGSDNSAAEEGTFEEEEGAGLLVLRETLAVCAIRVGLSGTGDRPDEAVTKLYFRLLSEPAAASYDGQISLVCHLLMIRSPCDALVCTK